MSARRRSLRTELLVSLGFVTSAAVVVVEVTTLLLAGGGGATAAALFALWLGSTGVFALFGLHVVQRLVLRPLEQLAAEADTLAAGRFDAPRPVYATAEVAQLAERYRAMAQDLLDVQSHIVRVEKLAGIGSLAAGVAHEVRNPLGAVGTYLDVLRRRGADPEVTGAMRGAIERIERTVQSLLTYASPGARPGTADANEAVETSLGFLRAQGLLKDQRVTVRLTPELPPVVGNQHGLEQVVVNLVLNACQATPKGFLMVGTEIERYEARDRLAARRSDVPAGAGETPRDHRDSRWTVRPRRTDVAAGTPGVLLYVADDGPGVPEADRERIFDPFYTTKAPGEGTGLGLAIVARTVHEAGGTVWLDRAREGGAVFKVFLPVAEAPASVSSPVEPSYAATHR